MFQSLEYGDQLRKSPLTPTEIIYDFCLIVGFTLTFVFFFLLIAKRKSDPSSLYLATFFLFVSILFLNYFSSLHAIDLLTLFTDLFTTGMGYLFGPLIYLFVRSKQEKLSKNWKQIALHFIPFLLFIGFVMAPLTIEYFNATNFRHLVFVREQYDFFYLLENTYFILYILFSLTLRKNFIKKYKENFSNTEIADQLWVSIFLIGALGIIFIDLGISTYFLLTPYEFDPDYLIAFLMISLITYLAYHGIFHSSVLSVQTSPAIPNKQKYPSQQAMKEKEDFSPFIEELHEYIQTSQCYLEDSLRLSDLCQRFDISEKKLSYIINQAMDSNFYRLINEYRLTEFKKRLMDRDFAHYTIWGIAEECGFKSKTSFHRLFKKEEGCTPSVYRKKN